MSDARADANRLDDEGTAIGDMPFETVESAHDYVRMLREQVPSVETEVVEGIGVAVGERATRRVDALRLVDDKLRQLDQHLGGPTRRFRRPIVRFATIFR